MTAYPSASSSTFSPLSSTSSGFEEWDFMSTLGVEANRMGLTNSSSFAPYPSPKGDLSVETPFTSPPPSPAAFTFSPTGSTTFTSTPMSAQTSCTSPPSAIILSSLPSPSSPLTRTTSCQPARRPSILKSSEQLEAAVALLRAPYGKAAKAASAAGKELKKTGKYAGPCPPRPYMPAPRPASVSPAPVLHLSLPPILAPKARTAKLPTHKQRAETRAAPTREAQSLPPPDFAALLPPSTGAPLSSPGQPSLPHPDSPDYPSVLLPISHPRLAQQTILTHPFHALSKAASSSPKRLRVQLFRDESPEPENSPSTPTSAYLPSPVSASRPTSKRAFPSLADSASADESGERPRKARKRAPRVKKADADKFVKRPLNAWMLYRTTKAKELAEEEEKINPTGNQQTLSTIIAGMWNSEPLEVHEKYARLAAEQATEHAKRFTNSHYRPRRLKTDWLGEAQRAHASFREAQRTAAKTVETVNNSESQLLPAFDLDSSSSATSSTSTLLTPTFPPFSLDGLLTPPSTAASEAWDTFSLTGSTYFGTEVHSGSASAPSLELDLGSLGPLSAPPSFANFFSIPPPAITTSNNTAPMPAIPDLNLLNDIEASLPPSLPPVLESSSSSVAPSYEELLASAIPSSVHTSLELDLSFLSSSTSSAGDSSTPSFSFISGVPATTATSTMSDEQFSAFLAQFGESS